MKQKKVIIIGAGIGGLSSALALSRSDLNITVVERHDYAGGKMRQLRVNSAAIDSGPTVFTMRWIFDELFESLGLSFDDYIELRTADTIARHSWLDGSRLDLFKDIDRTAEAISEFASPAEAKAYREFAQYSERVFNTLDVSFMRADNPTPISLTLANGFSGIRDLYDTKPFVTLWNDLGQRFKDQRLRQLFARYSTYCGSSPFLSPATLMLISHAERLGVWTIEGGMQQLARTLVTVAKQAGVTFKFGTEVKTIDVQNNRLSGVELKNGERLTADAAIFCGDKQALTEGLLGVDSKSAIAPRGRWKKTLSAITWSAQTVSSGFDLSHHNVFFGDDYYDEFDRIFNHDSITTQPTVYICAQDRSADSSIGENKGPERLFVLINAPATSLSDDQLQQHQSDTISLLNRHGLGLELTQENHIRSTPNEFSKLFPATDGALYGSAVHGWFGSFSRPGSRPKIDNLYLAGGSVHPGPGVPMAALSGRIAANALLSDLRT